MQFTSINDRVKSIKNNEYEVNRFVEEYKPFIASCTEKVTGRFVRYGEDDELSIALMAFVEAIKSYNFLRGNFLSFAQNVIKRRLIDYFRKEKKHHQVVPLNEYYKDDDEEEKDLSTAQSVENFLVQEISEYRRLELEELKKELGQWQISFMDLAEASPKHSSTRQIYSDIIRLILTKPDMIKAIKQKGYLPIADIEKLTGVPRKKIERARKYIIAVLIIVTGDYQHIKDYINWG